ncbi:Chain A, Putidaredoxin-Binding Stablilizes An Active Conformer Of Cytochrome P450cam In Its Reduced State; Crystal Structure Of Mutant(109k) Cytochrome P450cam [Sphingobium indicum BiD32]|uniref:Chain A, Putidaredoxin-Binding Stablilizes An Active Conformer Of Cytochrome P450cam In Its Reduced State Crystal Structure Of Mutant(109k) Cytochrome P450cam n=1 Tax=Sphingobium indicum BiD32 TaxID=1301087 RepID=N1MQZ2_9SPHN|nr:cytochrome P450 [Sphingobium indicum]CCW19144.1 Chain A, Putidaredoxin-Binding Stablilizes An Active Conformer Of Cytochrome P450cam In Its Reduced State; Crystal Structure Of Mutant(109k) Cytochrome P450cam [Sphingobium indicum BiD32]
MTMPVPDHVHPSLVTKFDIFQPSRPDEEYFAAWVRFQKEAKSQLLWSPLHGGHWIATDAELVMKLYEDSDTMSSRRPGIPVFDRDIDMGALSRDPPEHKAFRKPLNFSLSPARIRSMEQFIRAAVRELIDHLIAKGSCEFISEFADVIPLNVFISMVDLPKSDLDMLAGWARAITHPTAAATSDGPAISREQVMDALGNYLRPYIAQRRLQPGSDAISEVVNSLVDGRPMTDAEAIGACTHLMIAGLDTVASFLGFMMMFLAESPSHRQELVSNPAIMSGAIQEMIRRFPLTVNSRIARDEQIISGIRIKQGDVIALPTMLYNLDERKFPDPLSINFARKVNSQCTFGNGAHRCAGASLARLEIEIVLQEWLARIPNFRLAPQKLDVVGGIVASLRELHLIWQ